MSDKINGHARLLRSLSFGDDDYSEHVYALVPSILGESRRPRGLVPLDDQFLNLAKVVNFLRLDDWLQEKDPELRAEMIGQHRAFPDALAQETVSIFNIDEMARQLHRMQNDYVDDPEALIGECKDFIESACKTILGITGPGSSTRIELPKLVHRTLEALGLDAKAVDGDSVEAKAAKKFLGSVGQILEGVGELRNARGTGHGRSAVPELDADLARFVVEITVSTLHFLALRWKQQQDAGI